MFGPKLESQLFICFFSLVNRAAVVSLELFEMTVFHVRDSYETRRSVVWSDIEVGSWVNRSQDQNQYRFVGGSFFFYCILQWGSRKAEALHGLQNVLLLQTPVGAMKSLSGITEPGASLLPTGCTLHIRKVVTNTRMLSFLSFSFRDRRYFHDCMRKAADWLSASAVSQRCMLLYLLGERFAAWWMFAKGLLVRTKTLHQFQHLCLIQWNCSQMPLISLEPHSTRHEASFMPGSILEGVALKATGMSRWENVGGVWDQCATAKLLIDLSHSLIVPQFLLGEKTVSCNVSVQYGSWLQVKVFNERD